MQKNKANIHTHTHTHKEDMLSHLHAVGRSILNYVYFYSLLDWQFSRKKCGLGSEHWFWLLWWTRDTEVH